MNRIPENSRENCGDIPYSDRKTDLCGNFFHKIACENKINWFAGNENDKKTLQNFIWEMRCQQIDLKENGIETFHSNQI